MKKVVLAVAVTSVALAVSAHPRYEEKQHLGRCVNDNDIVPRTATVPESTPTIALTLVSLTAVGLLTAFLRSRKSGA